MRRSAPLPLPLVLSLPIGALLACTASDARDDHAHHGDGATAHAVIEARSGSQVAGEAWFVERAGGVQVTMTIRNASPGWHAAHVHEKGDCSAEDGSSAGGHFNPDGHPHGAPHAMEHHAGDLGNVWVEEDGTGYHVVFMPELTVAQGTHSVVGRAIIVHEKVDDLVTQPTGDAGGRIGCGVIQ
jgi:Cu-Zn family superoxide dismutase